MDDFIVRALIAGVGIALVAGLLGCFVVWKRMAYFGDSLAHSSLLGVAMGFALSIDVNMSVLATAAAFALLLTHLQSKLILSTDTVLGILAHGGLASGVVIISLAGNQHFDLHAFLFGDILVVTKKEIYLIYLGCAAVYTLVLLNWQKLILVTISPDLAGSMGVKSYRLQLVFAFLMAVSVAISIKIIGVLLISSMLIIPPAIARQISNSPKMMCAMSVISGIFAVIAGILLSYYLDTPCGPSIVVVCIAMFMLVFALRTSFLYYYSRKTARFL